MSEVSFYWHRRSRTTNDKFKSQLMDLALQLCALDSSANLTDKEQSLKLLTPSYAYTETKKFSNTSQILISITKIYVDINTDLIRFFCSKCYYNLIQYQKLQNFLRIECEFLSCYVKMNVRDETRHDT